MTFREVLNLKSGSKFLETGFWPKKSPEKPFKILLKVNEFVVLLLNTFERKT